MPIQPRSFSEVLTYGMQLLGLLWRRLLVPALGAAIPLGALTLMTLRVTGADDYVRLVLTDPTALDAMTAEARADASLPFIRSALIVAVFNLIAAGFVNLATHRLVGAQIASTPMTAGAAARFALRRLPLLVLAGAVAAVGIGVGLLLVVIPGIWLAVMLALTPQAMALEDLGATTSLRRSFELVRGYWLPTAGFLLVVGLLGYSAAWLIQLVAAPLVVVDGATGSSVLVFVLGTLLQGFVIASIAVMTTVWYVDLRARRETLLSETLG